MRVVVGLALLAAACAPHHANVRGHELPRLSVDYTDHHLFALTHEDAYPEPRGPSSGLRDYGGRLAGRVCGTELWLEADYRGRYMEIAGFYEPNDGSLHTLNQIQLEVRDYAGERHIRGSIGAGQEPVIGWVGMLAGADGHGGGRTIGDFAVHEGDRVIELAYNSGRLYGSISGQHFALEAADGDTFAGTVTAGGIAREYAIRGVSRLWEMPVADQAALLPMLLTCRAHEPERFDAGGRISLTDSMTPLEASQRIGVKR